ncbi:hypothetical protein [Microtetraspora sp. NBRC 16547]|uniref:hypothetical protein n=1 Tax=Microtetraspora sp. NBRC 16547 TaxID=3030993 RepID=UPI0024A49761|nr:hypothetical protein [Microtetraspora sp. NBRC 16547]GLX01216.1 hypothetical protein Misp02_53020 [Microtetraspora sp. NBRC 16547]
METLRLVLVFLHLSGFAALVGGFLRQMQLGITLIGRPVIIAAVAQFVTGALLIWIRTALDMSVADGKMAVKAGLDLTILLLAVAGTRIRPTWMFYGVGASAIAATGVAVFWT